MDQPPSCRPDAANTFEPGDVIGITAIDRVVDWLDKMIGLDGKAICDLGCGPGFYAERFARRGASVCGLDFSKNSIAYAKASAIENGVPVTFVTANYLTDPLPQLQDLITLIYCDLCPLSPAQRRILLGKIRKSLTSGGIFVFDVASLKAFEGMSEHTAFGRNSMGGFWSASDYFAFHNTYRYEHEKVSLDHFAIVEENSMWDVYNWMQYFTPKSIIAELKDNGFDVIEIVNGFGADGADDATFGVIAKPMH